MLPQSAAKYNVSVSNAVNPFIFPLYPVWPQLNLDYSLNFWFSHHVVCSFVAPSCVQAYYNTIHTCSRSWRFNHQIKHWNWEESLHTVMNPLVKALLVWLFSPPGCVLEAGKEVVFSPDDDSFEHQLDLRMVSSKRCLQGFTWHDKQRAAWSKSI